MFWNNRVDMPELGCGRQEGRRTIKIKTRRRVDQSVAGNIELRCCGVFMTDALMADVRPAWNAERITLPYSAVYIVQYNVSCLQLRRSICAQIFSNSIPSEHAHYIRLTRGVIAMN
jgi:hypothetical protein